MESIMEDPMAILPYIVGIGLTIGSIPILHNVPRSRGQNPVFHGIFVAAAIAFLLLAPDSIQNIYLSPGGVLVVGTLIPVYESIHAVCTIGEADDTAWLQYWITSATFSFATEWMDSIAQHMPSVAERWYELEFFIMLWLLLPYTDGSGLIYDVFTDPFISPLTKKLKEQLEGGIGIIVAAVNSGYLWMMWLTFMTLPEEARRFVVIASGTIYPLISSTFAITTETDSTDDTFWLTYWSCFNVLFVLMDYLETFIGSIPGFYSLCLCGTVYLFLPMFQGANAVFRNVLVPLSGQYEAMVLRDAYLVRKALIQKIPSTQRKTVLKKAADIFADEKDT